MSCKIIKSLTVIFMIILITSCGSTRKVSRLSSDQVTDLSGNWNDTDSRLVAEKMIRSLNSADWVQDYLLKNKRKPVIIVGTIRNLTSEHISTNTFIKDIEREIVKSHWLKFVASKLERNEIRDERIEQQMHASEETAKRMMQETGADFMLRGSINQITDAVEGQSVKYYQIDLELINIETNEKYWIDSKKIKKLIEQDNYKF